MKIRWTKGSVRLRITPSELEALQRGEAVREVLTLGKGGRWSAAIVSKSAITRIDLKGSDLVFSLSDAELERLALPEAEGVYYQQDGEPSLRYFIEKDFPCVHPRAAEAQEPSGETFRPPEGFADRKATEPL